jgi:hypothetical protein
MVQRVHFDDLDTDEYGYFYAGVFYQGQPFTGIAFQYNGKYLSEYHYLNGMAHGKWEEYYSNGQILEKIEFLEGKAINEEFHWYENGRLKSYDQHNTPRISRRWDESGLLLFERLEAADVERSWYPTGELKYVQNGKIRTYFTKSQEWICKVELPLKSNYQAETEYNDETIENHYREVFSDKEIMNYAWGWINSRFEAKRDRVINLLCLMARSNDLNVKCDAIFYIGEKRIREAAEIVRSAGSDHRVMLDVCGWGHTSPVSRLAREALGKLSSQD